MAQLTFSCILKKGSRVRLALRSCCIRGLLSCDSLIP